MLKLDVNKISKCFGQRPVFKDISFSLESGSSIAIVGPNGSGKSTLLRLLAGLLRPTSGEAVFYFDKKRLSFEYFRKRMAMVAPYISLYSALTAVENIRFFAEVNGFRINRSDIENILSRVGLGKRADDPVGEYSSGMHQRLKYAVAFSKKPEILLVDEPSANLDEDGKKIIYNAINSSRENSIVIVATNEKEEYSLAEGICQLG